MAGALFAIVRSDFCDFIIIIIIVIIILYDNHDNNKVYFANFAARDKGKHQPILSFTSTIAKNGWKLIIYDHNVKMTMQMLEMAFSVIFLDKKVITRNLLLVNNIVVYCDALIALQNGPIPAVLSLLSLGWYVATITASSFDSHFSVILWNSH